MASNYLTRTPSSSPTSEKKVTYSAWIKVCDKAGSIGLWAQHQSGGAGTNGTMLFINASSQLEFYATNGGSSAARVVTNRRLRDPNGWYLIQCHVDTSLSTATDRVKLYVNGSRETDLSTNSAPGQGINLNGFDGTGDQIFGSLDNFN